MIVCVVNVFLLPEHLLELAEVRRNIWQHVVRSYACPGEMQSGLS
jgi:hypothetical protein